MKPDRTSQIKVGLLILVALGVLGGTIFFVGQERRFFENRVPFEIRFSRILGLKVGAPISLAGVTVGSVEGMTFPQDLRANYIVVRIGVVGAVAPRIRKDTVARIRTQGVLGDKFIELSGGSSESDSLPPGGLISSVDPVDYEALLGEGGDAVQNFIEATNSLKTILKSVEEGKGLLGQAIVSDKGRKWSETVDNFHAASGSLKNILRSIEKGEGVVGQLVQNPEVGKRVVEDLSLSMNHLRKASESLQKTTEKLERGEGTLGTLIQDPHAGKEILANLRHSAANLEAVTRQLREGGGLLQRLVNDRPYADRVLGNLERTTRDLAEITGKIERGEGTIGALVNDPELYQEAKGLLGSAKGSWLISIRQFFRNLVSSGDDQPQEKAPGGGK